MIISISGKIGSGKDTVGEIIQIITKSPHFTDEAVLDYIGREHIDPIFENKKWANVLKDYVCMALGCTREQLEDREFKEKELGEEWWYYKGQSGNLYPYNMVTSNDDLPITKPTPRLLLQLIGTDAIRNHVHPNYWVNSLMSKYKEYKYAEAANGLVTDKPVYKYPNWVITDTRFPNELKAIKGKRGISIRVSRNRPHLISIQPDEFTEKEHNRLKEMFVGKEHESETALDNAEFDYTIDNNKTIIELIGKVREILIKENIIKW